MRAFTHSHTFFLFFFLNATDFIESGTLYIPHSCCLVIIFQTFFSQRVLERPFNWQETHLYALCGAQLSFIKMPRQKFHYMASETCIFVYYVKNLARKTISKLPKMTSLPQTMEKRNLNVKLLLSLLPKSLVSCNLKI
jgi:hypothetical protein